MKIREYLNELIDSNPKQDAVIDGVRAISVLSIIAFHIVTGIALALDAELRRQFILELSPWLQPLWHAEKGVDAFFFVSAVVLGVPLFKKLDSFNWPEAIQFYKKRFFRIYPLFFVALVIYTIAQWSYRAEYFWSNALLINNLIPGHKTIVPVGWSLLVEVQYYVVLPAFLILLSRMKNYRVHLLIGAVLSSFLVLAYRLYENPQTYLRPMTDLFLSQDADNFRALMGEKIYEANSTRYGAFVVGLLAAFIKVNYSGKAEEFFDSKFTSTIIFVLACLCLFVGVGIPTYNPNSWFYDYWNTKTNFIYIMSVRQTFAIGILLIVMGAWFSDIWIYQQVRRLFHSRIWIPISRMSFPIYLFHFPFIVIGAIVYFRSTDVKLIQQIALIDGIGIFIIATALTLLFSIPLYVYVERPFTDRIKSMTK